MNPFDFSRDALIAEFTKWTPHAVRIVVILIGVFIIRFILKATLRRIIHLTERASGDQMARVRTLTSVLRNALEVILWSIAAALVLAEIGINLGPILAAAGVVGIAVGFGAQSLVKDMVNGFFVLLEDHVRVGDVIRAGDKSGLVEHISLRTIALRDFNGNVHIIPHSEISSITNMTMEYSRALIEVGVAYSEDIERVMQVLMEEAQALKADPVVGELILDEPEVFGIDEFADSAIILKVRFKTKGVQKWTVARAYRLRIKKRFDAEGIEIPFPHRTVYFGNDSVGKAPPIRVKPDQSL